MEKHLDSALLAQLEALQFAPPIEVLSRLSVADLFPKTKRRGLYVLHTGDEHYLGRTENISRRFHEHLPHHPDTFAISFRHLSKGDLQQVEQQGIRTLERYDVRLRNSAGMSLPMNAGSDLDDLVPLPEQESWRQGRQIICTGRSHDENVLRRQERKWQQFQKRSNTPQLLNRLEKYVRICLIAPGVTEMALWSVTCFAARGGFRVNASWQEVFRTLDGEAFFLLVAPSILEEAYGSGWAWHLQSLGVESALQMYRFPGHDHAALFVHGLENASRLLDMPVIVKAARELTWRCMRKAPNPNGRSHAPQMVDFLGVTK